jgi:predicted glycoside hydrolase/deacetylase ChbG (UPF0249 family)
MKILSVKRITTFLVKLFITVLINGQEKQNLGEKLGYPKDAKLFIVYMDDTGMSHSVNMAIMAAFEKNNKVSGSIMVPCPSFFEIAEFAKNHPNLDIEVHFTLTSEWEFYKWGGVLPKNEISSLLNKVGYFYPAIEDIGINTHSDEAEKELRAQIEREISFGVSPSQIDTHNGSIAKVPDGLSIMLKLSKEFILLPFDIKMVGVFALKSETAASVSWNEAYRKYIEGLRLGLNRMIVQVGFDNDEMQGICKSDKPLTTLIMYKKLGICLAAKGF